MIFDTDILIWIQRGNLKAARLVDKTDNRIISIITYMELFQCAQNKNQQKVTRQFLNDFNFMVLPLTQNIGHRASITIETLSLSTGIRTNDALIASTAIENNLPLVTSNKKHFKKIENLDIRIFKPSE